MIKIKICGIRRPEDVIVLNQLMPDYAGFVFADSKRQISVREAERLSEMMDRNITRVGVFAGQSPEFIAELLNAGIIHRAQLHGDENQEYRIELKKRIRKPENRKLILAYRINTKKDIRSINIEEEDDLLLDSGITASGGSGLTFDWSVTDGMNRSFFLAGGLNEKNIASAVKQVRPWAVDVSSGVETDGYKDPEKMHRFISELRRAEEQLQ